ncbi:MAG: 1,4-alpha-glucan branching enzyme, partial [Chlamydiae bacterium]|nr:1,4-alpha-glucan branching enzyme [Chlamydiota bacterium]
MWHDPHAAFGLHDLPLGQVIRLWRPNAEWVDLEVLGKIVNAKKEGDFFSFYPEKKIQAIDYRVYHHSGLLAHDPYAFWPTIGEMDIHLFNKGCHYELYKVFGANRITVNGVQGVRFAVWAPNAKNVSLVADFNHWDGRMNPMRSMGSSGIWELFVPGLQEGEKYKFEIRTKEGYLRVKSDPFAFYSELRPHTASIVADVNRYTWKDREWMEKRVTENLSRPIRIYEVHLGSWRRYDSYFPNYRTIAKDLTQYVKEMHFTHVEILPVMEHPLDESWGYQVSGFFSVTSRYGSVEDFQFFVDYL